MLKYKKVFQNFKSVSMRYLISATCNDDIQNGDEKGKDCGGTNCAPCGKWLMGRNTIKPKSFDVVNLTRILQRF